MKLIDGAGRILLTSFSMHCIYLGVLVLVLPEFLYGYYAIEVNPIFTGLSGLALILYGGLGRVVKQGNGFPWKFAALVLATLYAISMYASPVNAASSQGADVTVAEVLAPVGVSGVPTVAQFNKVAIPLVARWEGKRNNAYKDIVGVVTICYGHTKTAEMGQHKTDAECNAMLGEELLEYREGIHKYYNPATLAKRLTPERDAAYTSLAYNVGVGGAGKSTATKRLNLGQLTGGCEAITWWNKAGGRAIRGLTLRRTSEYELCMVGV